MKPERADLTPRLWLWLAAVNMLDELTDDELEESYTYFHALIRNRQGEDKEQTP